MLKEDFFHAENVWKAEKQCGLYFIDFRIAVFAGLL